MVPCLSTKATTGIKMAKLESRKVGADEAPAQQGGRAKNALRAAADGETAKCRLRELLIATSAAFYSNENTKRPLE